MIEININDDFYISGLGFRYKCPDCIKQGYAIERDFKYCPYCGEQIKWIDEELEDENE